MWGQENVVVKKLRGARIIPTRVGTSRTLSATLTPLRDHPHACGDKLAFAFPSIVLLGSSPRVWGQVVDLFSASLKKRIIPTRVGTRLCAYLCCLFNRDHPHACGDKVYNISRDGKEGGSSPRVWGQADVSVICSSGQRIIPTRVGTRVLPFDIASSVGDHPHACGDKVIQLTHICSKLGSSPRVWGQAFYFPPALRAVRIIPTRVGTRKPRLAVRLFA